MDLPNSPEFKPCDRVKYTITAKAVNDRLVFVWPGSKVAAFLKAYSKTTKPATATTKAKTKKQTKKQKKKKKFYFALVLFK